MTETKIDERIISGVGLLRVPAPDDLPRYYSILVDVIRSPTRIFLSKKWNPERQRYATMTSLRGGYVIAEIPVDYPQRRFDFIVDPTGQNLIGIKCAYQGILQSFANLGTAQGLIVTSVVDQVKAFTSLDMSADEYRFVCEEDTALQVRLFYDHYDTCNPETPQQKKPPTPPPPLAKVPTGYPIGSISPAYDGNDHTTLPYPTDSSEPPLPQLPYGTAGSPYLVQFDWDRQIPTGTFADTQHFSASIYAPITDYGLTQDGTPVPGGSGWGAYVIGHNFQGLDSHSSTLFGYPGSGAAVNIRNISITPQ